MTLYEHILNEKQRLNSKLTDLNQKIHAAPPGTLVCQKNQSRYKYFQLTASDNTSAKAKNYHYLGKKDSELIRALAEKTMNKKRRTDCQQELDAIHAYLQIHNKNVNRSDEKMLTSEAFRRILLPSDHTIPEELQQWQNSTYPHNPQYPEALTVPSVRGEFVRSKSEAFIAFSLYSHQIPFRYECELRIKSMVFYPDFTIRQPSTGETLIWEHFGMMDDPVYVKKAAYKLKTFLEHGWIPNHNLFTTYESDSLPFDLENVNFIVEHMIL